MITETRHEHAAVDYRCGIKCISWSAIIVGALVALGLTFLFHLFSLGTSMVAFNTTSAGADTVAIGGFIGILISVIIAMFVGGWVSGYLAKATCYNEYMGVLYGFTTWCLALLLTAWMSFHVSNLVSYHYRGLHQPDVASFSDNDSAATANDSRASNADTKPTNSDRNADANASNTKAQADTNNANTRSDSATAAAANAAPALGLAFFVMFILFFVGALASCFGGYFGLKSRCGERDLDRPKV